MKITPNTLSSLEQTLYCFGVFLLLLLLFMNVMSTAFCLWFPFIWNPGKPETQNKIPTLCLPSVGLETSLGLMFIFSLLPTGIRIRHWTHHKIGLQTALAMKKEQDVSGFTEGFRVFERFYLHFQPSPRNLSDIRFWF